MKSSFGSRAAHPLTRWTYPIRTAMVRLRTQSARIWSAVTCHRFLALATCRQSRAASRGQGDLDAFQHSTATSRLPKARTSPRTPNWLRLRRAVTLLRRLRRAAGALAHLQQVFVSFLEGGDVDRVGGQRRLLLDELNAVLDQEQFARSDCECPGSPPGSSLQSGSSP